MKMEIQQTLRLWSADRVTEDDTPIVMAKLLVQHVVKDIGQLSDRVSVKTAREEDFQISKQ